MGAVMVWFLAIAFVGLAVGAPVGVVVSFRRGDYAGGVLTLATWGAALWVIFGPFGRAFVQVML